MQTTIQYRDKVYMANLDKPIDISIPLRASEDNPVAWYLGAPEIEPVQLGDWTGSVAAGASTNFNNIRFNPHAHGTHTECAGHITREFYNVNDVLKRFFFIAELISIQPEPMGEDLVITKTQVETALHGKEPEAVVLRTLPNDKGKLTQKYSHTNPPYLEEAVAVYLRETGVKHLLIDLPSVDREKDDGKLLAHKAFWNVNEKIRLDATITEFIFVPDTVPDGSYLLNLQIASFVNDASPSKPVLYKISGEIGDR
ncbi:cyclase family protein [Sinomicrobium weinanense]|uniref:Cyclase family protein n=1 Tax=Sinomicrobium weinanense TaxID=2842200 RepID=A0A926Q5R8_9FLAO|nr:cyclase family protein [Sinomicrobium weinanense]MBC9798446.1 cyclase family protein [Sinomicrobium weinanense]MBU3125194.1 cyclase family protein [Sinomicrobium weinanense]